MQYTERRSLGQASGKVWMYDVDGVLVSLLSKQADEALIDILAQQLYLGDFITFNSGRSPMAIAELVLSLLEQRITHKELLSRMMIVGEKGGAWANYTPDGTLQMAFDTDLTVPSLLKSAMTELAEERNFREVLEIEKGKRTMISVAKRKGISLETFQLMQARFLPRAQQCLSDFGLDTAWKIDAVSDSIEIEPKSAGKHKGTYRIICWLRDQDIHPQRVIAIEDSPSGVTMAEVLHQMGIPVEFVFTGPQQLPHTYAFPIIYTSRKYEQGTIEYFAQHYLLAPSNVRG